MNIASTLLNNIFCLFCQKEKYVVTYDPEKYQAFAVLKVGATSDDVLQACFHVSCIM